MPKVGPKLAQSWPKVGPKLVWICPPPQWQSSNSLVLEQGQTLWLWICQISRGYCHQKEWIVTLLSTRIGCKTCQWVLPGNYLIQIFNYVLNYKWYIFCYQNFSDLLWEKIVLVTEKNFEAEGREFANFLGSLEWFIQTAKSQNNVWNKMFFNLFLKVSQIW